MKRLDQLSHLCMRAMQIVRDEPPSPYEAARFQVMCDRLAQEFPKVPDKRIQAVIQFYDERRGMI